MSEHVTFAGSGKNAIGWVLMCLGMIVFLLWAGFGTSFMGWAVLVLIGVSAGYYIVPILRPDSLYLRLDENGLEIADPWLAKLRIQWSQMEELKLVPTTRGGQRLRIVYSRPNSKPGVRTLDSDYTTPLFEILPTLKEWRQRHGTPR